MANPPGAGSDRIAVTLVDESTHTPIHQTGGPGAPVTISQGNIGNAFLWTF